jgi:hypothetical protein
MSTKTGTQSKHYTVQHSDGSVRFILPSRRQWFPLIYSSLWLTVWMLGGISIVRALIVGEFFSRGALEPLACLAFWILIGANVLRAVLWQFIGKEVVIATAQSITTRRQILGLVYSKKYFLGRIEDLRIVSSHERSVVEENYFRIRMSTGEDGLIAFTYGKTTHRFGCGVTDLEAIQILATIQQYFPEYRSKSWRVYSHTRLPEYFLSEEQASALKLPK